jgi:hypothetical protein
MSQGTSSADGCRAIVERYAGAGMNGEVRRTVEMVGRTVNFDAARPDSDAGQTVLETRLKDVKAQMEEMAALQRSGLIDVHTGAEEKRRLRREMLAGPIAHLSEIGGLAAKDHPELIGRIRYKPSGDSYLAHLTAARSMQAEATEHKEALTPFGLSEAVLNLFGQLLDQFDVAVKLGSDGRGKHKGATRRLQVLALEGGQIVRAMDARNHHRFKHDPQALEEWLTASTVVGRAVTGSAPAEQPAGGPGPAVGQAAPGSAQGGTPAGGDVRPAA